MQGKNPEYNLIPSKPSLASKGPLSQEEGGRPSVYITKHRDSQDNADCTKFPKVSLKAKWKNIKTNSS